MSERPIIHALAGVNGAGKSSIGESEFNRQGSPVFNPDTVAQKIRTLHPDIPLALANAHAWQIGKSLLEQAIAEGRDYRFETTLGGNTIARLLEQAARGGHKLHLWFCGLASADLHLRRVRSRVAHGGHDIPEEKIRERWNGTRNRFSSWRCNAKKSPRPPISPALPTGPNRSSPRPSTSTPQGRARQPVRHVRIPDAPRATMRMRMKQLGK
jgi:predicted ABC-type ATPase